MKTSIEKRIMNYLTDSFGIVHHARYFEVMEEGRWLYCYENQLVEQFLKMGIYHVVVDININYKGSARFGDLIIIETEVFRVTEKSVIFRQVVSRDDQRLIIAYITNVFLRRADKSVITAIELGMFWHDLLMDKNTTLTKE